MNHETDTPRTDLKELELSQVKYPHDFYALGDLCRKLERELTEKNNEVARLRGEKDKIAEIAWEAVNRLFDVSDSLDEIPLKLQTQLEALGPIPTLAPAPEEAKTSYEYLPKPNHDLVHRTPAPEEALPKQEMPLEKELTAIEDGNPWIDPSKNILICIRYLRDEIETLKKNQK